MDSLRKSWPACRFDSFDLFSWRTHPGRMRRLSLSAGLPGVIAVRVRNGAGWPALQVETQAARAGEHLQVPPAGHETGHDLVKPLCLISVKAVPGRPSGAFAGGVEAERRRSPGQREDEERR